MTDQKDIIERAREFLKRLDERDCIDHEWKWIDRGRRDRTPDVSGRLLAQALTLAVEALEGLADDQVEEQRGHLKITRPTRAAIKAMKALSRIRSLSA